MTNNLSTDLHSFPVPTVLEPLVYLAGPVGAISKADSMQYRMPTANMLMQLGVSSFDPPGAWYGRFAETVVTAANDAILLSSAAAIFFFTGHQSPGTDRELELAISAEIPFCVADVSGWWGTDTSEAARKYSRYREHGTCYGLFTAQGGGKAATENSYWAALLTAAAVTSLLTISDRKEFLLALSRIRERYDPKESPPITNPMRDGPWQ